MLRYLRTDGSARRPPRSDRRPALLVDRDGVLNARAVGGYVTDPADIVTLDAVVPLAAAATRLGAVVVVVTNQGCIARGIATEGAVMAVNLALVDWLAGAGVAVDGVYVCPHHPLAADPAARVCGCRKPLPGLIVQALADLDIDPGRSILLGDQPSDLAAGEAAGLAPGRCILFDAASVGRAELRAIGARISRDLAPRAP